MICLKKLLLAKLTNRKTMKFVKRENESGEIWAGPSLKEPISWSRGLSGTERNRVDKTVVVQPRSVSGLSYFYGIQLIIINQNKYLQSLSS